MHIYIYLHLQFDMFLLVTIPLKKYQKPVACKHNNMRTHATKKWGITMDKSIIFTSTFQSSGFFHTVPGSYC